MKRIIGILIDTLIVVAMATGILMFKFDQDSILTLEFILIVLCTVIAVYGILFELTARATLGKLIMKKVIANENGKRVNPVFVIVRNFIKILLPSFVCFMYAIDRSLGSIVIKHVDGQVKCIMGSTGSSGDSGSMAGVIVALVLIILLVFPFLFTKRHRFLHDIFSGSYVMNKEDAMVLAKASEMKAPVIPPQQALPSQQVQTPTAYLVCVEGQLKGQKWPLANGLILGKDANVCNVVFDEYTMNVSDVHCKVFEQDGMIWVRDLKSSYGVKFEGGVRLPSNYEATINLGQSFTFGYGQTFKVEKE